MRFLEESGRLVQLINKTFKSEDYRLKYVRYVENLALKGLPPFISFSHMAELFGIESQSFYDLTFRTAFYYTTLEIPKRAGGSRKISAPYPDLAAIQSWIHSNILLIGYPNFSPVVTGYVRNKSIIDHVRPHVDSVCLIKFDIKDFFPSITSSQVTKIFSSLGYSLRVSRTLAALVTLDGSLPQGACTSPLLSNIRMFEFDRDLEEFCIARGFKYTRYADDIVVSGGESILAEMEAFYLFFKLHGLLPNQKKTMVYRSSKQVRFITGLIVQNGSIRLPKAMRRQIRAECHYLMKAIPSLRSGKRDDYDQVSPNPFLRDPLAIEQVIGKLNYWLHIEPESPYPAAVKKMLFSQI